MSRNEVEFINYENYLDQYRVLDPGSIRAFEYTKNAIIKMDQVLSSIEFEERDVDCIFRYLDQEIDMIPFGMYLKRYIYKKAELEEDFSDISDREYQEIIKAGFRENRTPLSWQETTKKPGSIIKRWLHGQSVLRKTIFLLGFGLHMNEKDVSEFLLHGNRDSDFNFYDPEEVLYWHCYHCGKKYPQYLDLKERAGKYQEKNPRSPRYWESVAQNPEAYLFDEEKVIGYISYLAGTKKKDPALEEFMKLIEIAGSYCEEGGDLSSRIEKKFCSGIPRNRSGNLRKAGESSFARNFMYRKMSRQRLDAIMKKRQEPDRFDLITLMFFICSLRDEEPDRRRDHFIFEINRVLIRARMSCLLFSIPYEAFVIMCLMTDDPLVTYSEVWEMSFQNRSE